MISRLAVIGCGKMGLPLAVQASSRGIEVYGVDINPELVYQINKGECPINEPGVESLLKEAVTSGRLKATTSLVDAVSHAEAVIVIVPVLLKEKHADLETIKSVAEEIGKCMKPGTVVSFETTVPVGTTRNVLGPLLEKSGLAVEKDFYLVFSPERVKSLKVMERLDRTPKIVGGAGPVSLERGLDLYRSMLSADVLSVGSLEHAEMAKIIDMVYRDVNIALVNEISRYCDKVGINLSEIIPVANTSGEAHLLYQGIGVGGHCTPVYPYFLIDDARERGVPQLLTEAARKINDGQSDYLIGRLEKMLGSVEGFRILLLGLGFRPGVKEDAESTAYLVRDAAESRGAEVFLCDPMYSEEEISERGFLYAEPGAGGMDIMILVTAHEEFLSMDFKQLKKNGLQVFVDGRNCYSRVKVERAGVAYIGIGNG
jgi:nucleotide sugar dehydrogenase